ncbi:UNVERIFIED_CONTAM: hypothetical protein FKN15_065503 [Acipenser sinensis]
MNACRPCFRAACARNAACSASFQKKRLKAAEAESKLKQVYIPNYNKPNPNQLNVNNVKPNPNQGLVNGAGGGAEAGAGTGTGTGTGVGAGVVTGEPGQSTGAGRACESCYTTYSYQWYSWGPPNMQCRLCASCWTYWKKYGGLRMPTRLDGERPGPNRNNMSPHGLPMRHSGSPKFAVKTRQAFYLQTTNLTKVARRLCRDILRPQFLGRHPYTAVNSAAIKAEFTTRLSEIPENPLTVKQTVRKPLESVVRYLETHPSPKPDPPRSATISMGSLTPIKSSPILNNGSPTILGKRSYEQHNGMDGPNPNPQNKDYGVFNHILAGLHKLQAVCLGDNIDPCFTATTSDKGPSQKLRLNGKFCPASGRLIRGGCLAPAKRRTVNWIDAPGDLLFIATKETRKIRKLFSSSETKRAARRPNKSITVKPSQTAQSHRLPANDELIVIED